MATPSCVNAMGALRDPPQLDITVCDLKFANSLAVSRNMKSPGNRPALRLTA